MNNENNSNAPIPQPITKEYARKLTEMLRYIVSGEKPSSPNTDIDDIEMILLVAV